ncbi:MAG TPA: hypothetical protein VG935_00715 [Patescibacteria group bacterium]|nr:hypothetical protein [Patescibacteria group bacterium]
MQTQALTIPLTKRSRHEEVTIEIPIPELNIKKQVKKSKLLNAFYLVWTSPTE